MMNTLRKASLVVVGEVHDNPDHHAFQADVAGARTGAAVFEHIAADKSEALARWFAARVGDADKDAHALLAALDWGKSGWPPAAMFAPLFAAALRAGLIITPGDVPRARMAQVARQGEAALPAPERQSLHLDAPLPAPVEDALLDELEASHCGLVPRTQFGAMAFAQRYRDAALADAVLAAIASQGAATLFAGNGHARADRGVPLYIRRRQPELRQRSVLQLEVEDGRTSFQDYAPAGTADFILFTPAVARPDPCEAMRKSFQPRK